MSKFPSFNLNHKVFAVTRSKKERGGAFNAKSYRSERVLVADTCYH